MGERAEPPEPARRHLWVPELASDDDQGTARDPWWARGMNVLRVPKPRPARQAGGRHRAGRGTPRGA